MELLIQHNLWQFLSALKSEKHPLVLWIDAIYIKQADIEERNKQVAVMGDIYWTASAVRAWLGLEGDESRIASRLAGAPQLSARLAEIRELKTSPRTPHIIPFNHEHDSENGLNRISAVQLERSLDALGHRSYWTRIRIVQEILLADSCIYTVDRML